MNAIGYFAIMKNLWITRFKAIYYISAIFLMGVVALIYFGLGQSEHTVPKIKLSYFKNNDAIVNSIGIVLQQQLLNQKYVWLGVEPGHENQIDFSLRLKSYLESKNGPFDFIILDQELDWPEMVQKNFNINKKIYIKENWFEASQVVKNNPDKKILIITAAIYSTNLIKQNPVDKVKSETLKAPMTFSLGYFASNTTEERNNIFSCVTDDKEGVAAWGCLVVNKARSQRRKIDLKKISGNEPLIAGLMDLTGENDYMILFR